MTRRLLKVHRVRDAAEALAFEQMGADFIGVDLRRPEAGHDDGRFLDEKAALDVRRKLGRARLVGELPFELAGRAEKIARRLGLDWVQLPGNVTGTPGLEDALCAAGVGIVYTALADYDDEPEWVVGRYERLRSSVQRFLELELNACVEDAWSYTRAASAYPEELQVADVDEIASRARVLLALDFSPKNVADVLERLPHVAGLALTLAGAQDAVRGRHVHAPDSALRVIAALEKLAGFS